MVLLTIIADSSDHTVYFKEPIPKPNYIRLLFAVLSLLLKTNLIQVHYGKL